MSSIETRKKLAALNFTEKAIILEKLRDLSRVLAAAGLRRKPVGSRESRRESNRQGPEKTS
ncbi:MAG: hypothetical protein ABSD20_15805 [Terriglobales bacterium]